jgi:hypothetical protein
VADHAGAHLGRVALRPEIRADDIPELDLVQLLELPAVDPTAADEGAVLVAEHPDPEPVLAPVRQLAVEELTSLLLAVGGGVERGDHALVAMERAQVGEVGLGERTADEPPRHDRVWP